MSSNVAIIGFSFRLPGTTQETFWNDLLAGRDLVTSVPENRWSQETFTHPLKDHPGTSYTFKAGSIGDVSLFDAGFFGISPREAAVMDPQQRLLLELGWEVFEQAGIKPSSIRGSNCSVFVGISNVDYAYRLIDNLEAVDSSGGTGNTSSIAANRLSYFFDLHGPSMAIDTACSSSLVAFHQACASIRSGESSMALAGGVSLHLHPYTFVAFSKASMLSRKGHCNVFDASCDGYVRSEGAGLFLLKDYDQAVADGDRILAVVAASAVNTDGRKSGLTVPNTKAQSALLQQVYSRAGIKAAEIDYIEAHGTGTPVGDPLEAQAIGEALGVHRPTDRPLPIGSIKSNLGHLESAAGAAGMVKALTCLQHRTIPATIGITSLNPAIPFNDLNLEVVTDCRPINKEGEMVIGINSFGFGGANAHVVLKSHASGSASSACAHPNQLPLLISAKTPKALKQYASHLAAYLDCHQQVSLYDITYNTLFRRETFDYQTVFFASTHTELSTQLQTFAASETDIPPSFAAPPSAKLHGAVFVYSGNGAQWFGMGKELLSEPLFLETIREIDAYFCRYADWSIEEELNGKHGTDRYDCTEIAQPALFAIQVGMTQMLRQRGIHPAAVTGHSVGEVAAAWACGALSLEAATQVIYHRSQLQGTTKGQGQMTAVGTGAPQAAQLLAATGLTDFLTIAGINSGKGVTVTGAADHLAQFEQALTDRNIFCRRLALDYAFHSPAMDPLQQGICTSLAPLQPQSAVIPFYSTVTGSLCEGTSLHADYWWHNLRQPVLFAQAITQMLEDGAGVFIEVSPHAILQHYLRDCLNDASQQGCIINTGLRDDDGPHKILETVKRAMASGIPVNWDLYFPRKTGPIDLPHYPWQREQHWHAVTPESHGLLYRYKEHGLLGYRLPQHELVWENQLDTQLVPMLADHRVGDAIVFPGAGFVELALAAAHAWQPGECCVIDELEINSALLLKADRSKLIRTSIDPSHGGLEIRAKELTSSDPWEHHVKARILIGTVAGAESNSLPLPQRLPDFSGTDHQRLTEMTGLGYGPSFQGIVSGWREGGSVTATLHPTDDAPDYHLHPASLDCAFQLIFHLLNETTTVEQGMVFIPVKIGRVILHGTQRIPQRAQATLLRRSPHSLLAEFVLADVEGHPVASILNTRFKAVRLTTKRAEHSLRFLRYHTIPCPHPLMQPTEPPLLYNQFLQEIREAVSRSVLKGSHRSYSEEIDPLLDVLCSRFTLEALRPLTGEDRLLTGTALDDVRSISPEAARHLDYLLSSALQDGSITAVGNGWELPECTAEDISAQDIWFSLFHDHPDSFPLLHAVARTGLHLKRLIAGEISETSVSVGTAMRTALFHNLLGSATQRKLEQALGKLIFSSLKALPAGNRLDIMEISDGQPLFASAICRTLDFNHCSYLFATPHVETAADLQQQLDRFPAAEIRVFTTGSEPGPSGNERCYHLAIVNADFAGIEETGNALRYAFSRLAPDGCVLFLAQHPSRWADFVFGGQKEWWHLASQGSPLSPLQPPLFWQKQMEQIGFLNIECGELSPQTSSGPYLLLGQSPGSKALDTDVQTYENLHRGWLIVTDQQGYSAELARHLADRIQQMGGKVALTSSNSSRVLADELQKLEKLQVARYGIIHLQGLAPSSLPVSTETFFATQTERCVTAAAIAELLENGPQETVCWLITASTPDPADTPQTHHTATVYPDAALWGFGRTLINECPHGTIRLVTVDTDSRPEKTAFLLATELACTDDEQEVQLTADGKRLVCRLQDMTPTLLTDTHDQPDDATPYYRLGFQFPGQLRNLRWETWPSPTVRDDEIEVEVCATGLNFRDFMYALGLLSDEAVENGFAGATLGMEFSGRVLRTGSLVQEFVPGDLVVGFSPACFSNRVITRPNAVTLIPSGLSLESAVTIPAVFLTSYYALHHLARLEPGEKVLIHGAAGGVGIAAIQVARWCGAEIHATAGSEEKRDFLRMLGVEHIYDSRSLDFADEILTRTNGSGVDVVLNSLSGEAINRNLQVLKPFGRFLELGKRDFYENTRIGLRPFRNNISYFGIDADQLMQERPELTRRLFTRIMELFAEGIFHPLPFQRFDADEIVQAFRYMQQSRQIGKIIVTYHNSITPAPLEQLSPPPNLELASDATFLVTGGLSGFGLQTAAWLARKGCRSLLLLSRSGPVSEESQQVIAQLRKDGVTVHAVACDVTDKAALTQLLQDASEKLPPLKGVVHAAMAIHDGLIKTMDSQQIRTVLAPKILGAAYLHELTRHLPIDYFILFSSATTLFGNPGQGNYVAANYWLEALALQRRSAGLPATCIGWSPISDAGYLARHQQIKEALQNRLGGEALSCEAALNQLEQLLVTDQSGLGVLDLDWQTLSRSLPSAAGTRFSELARKEGVHNEQQEQRLDIQQLVTDLSAEELLATLIELLKQEVGAVLRIDPSKLDPHQPLADMGLDSLMGVELAVALESLCGVKIPVLVLSDSPTILKLTHYLIGQLTTPRSTSESGDTSETEELVQQVLYQHATAVSDDVIDQIVQTVQTTTATDKNRMIS